MFQKKFYINLGLRGFSKLFKRVTKPANNVPIVVKNSIGNLIICIICSIVRQNSAIPFLHAINDFLIRKGNNNILLILIDVSVAQIA